MLYLSHEPSCENHFGTCRDLARAGPGELADVAREIEARRTGVYVLDEDEKAAIDKARRSPIVPDDEVSSFWKRRGVK